MKNGIDYEIFTMGAEMAVYHIEAGVRKFHDFVEKMVADLGDDVRPYLKMFYNAARDYPGMEELRKEMTPYDEVEATDVFSICQNEEMKDEAIHRMKSISLYDGVIESFEEDGTPQVYEPPYGASYWVEDDVLERVREIEKSKDILVWGITRRFVKNILTGENDAVDHLLYVSKSKEKWQEEREQLINGNPHVYTLWFGRLDSKLIKIYISEGGTPLIR